jgi:Zn-dependent M32 family carboxypeptidase
MSASVLFNQLKSRLRDVHNLRMAEAVLSWDQEVYMPPKGAAARGAQLATLSAQAHRLFFLLKGQNHDLSYNRKIKQLDAMGL